MCKITGKYTESEKFTGYKLVYIIDGRYYSPVTGVEYKVGEKVTATTEKEAIHNTQENDALFTLYTGNRWVGIRTVFNEFFEPAMVGKTGVFVNLINAKDIQSNETIVRMTISGDLVEGLTLGRPIIAGNFIEAIQLTNEG